MHLIAVQPWITLDDYASAHAFERKLDSFEASIRATRARLGNERGDALVVFPEMIGSFLMLAGERLGPVRTVDGAMALAASRHGPEVLRTMARFRLASPARAVLAVMSRKARRLYVDAFARAARRLGVFIAAGSALLPDVAHDAAVDAEPASARVYNTSYLFDPSGRVIAQTRKVNLVPELETGLGISAGAASEVPIVSIGTHRVATLVCYDGFSEPHTRNEPHWVNVAADVAGRGAAIIVQPAANPWPWNSPWVHNEPGELLIRRDQWRCEGLVGQLPKLDRVRYAVTAQLLGRVLDVAFEGRSEIVERARDGEVRIVASAARADGSVRAEEVIGFATGE